MSGQISHFSVKLWTIFVLTLKNFFATFFEVKRHVLLDVHFPVEVFLANVAGESLIALVLLATVLDEQ